MFLMLAAAARTFVQPIYWIATFLLVVVYNAVRFAFATAHPWRRISIVPEERTEFRAVTVSWSGRDA